MKLASLVIFGAGYVMGTKAGRERYAQIVTVAQAASKRLDEFSARNDADDGDVDLDSGDRDARRQEAAV